MAHLYRLIALVLLLAAGSAFASFPATSGPDPTDSCKQSNYPPQPGYVTNPNVTSYNWAWHGANADNGGWEYWSATYGWNPLWNGACNLTKPKVPSCPANSTLSGTSCSCNTGFNEKDGQCLPPNRDDKCAGDFTLSGFALGSGKLLDTQIMKGEIPGGSMCWPYDAPGSGCTVNFVQDKVVTMPDGSKQTYGRIGMYVGPAGTTQGKACDIPAPDTTVSADCKNVGSVATETGGGRAVCADAPKCEGGYAGTVNGVEVCVKDDGTNVVRSEKVTETKKPDGSTEKVTEKTTCQGKVCTTEKTTTNTPAGGGSSSTNITNISQPKEDYCKASANVAQCGKDGKGDGKEGSFGGSCDAGFTCEGDALQCSMAREQHERACQLFSKKSNESLLYDGEASKGRDRDVTKTLPGNTTEDLSGKLSQENVLGGGRCISDLNITVWRTSVALPLSAICPGLDYMGWVLVAISSLVAFRIVSGSSKGD